ncbi:MAG TPA: DUF1573 domain-containing protein [Verrucomicrobiae bacterium]|nr:DUF1573 domain-containing protein [Verrucomicrobiae bacterium]
MCLAVVLGHAKTATPTAKTAAATATALGPRIQFDAPIYEFGRMRSGEPVKHTFIFTNTGDATLEIKNVHPGCGCTAAGEWTHSVEPGNTGTIPIQVNTANFNGQVAKTVTVQSNDPRQPSMVLQIKGTLWKPVDVMPQLAYMSLSEDLPNTTTTVRVVNNMDQPITLDEPTVSNKAFTAKVKTVKPGKEFQVVVGVVPPLKPGAVQGAVSIHTSSPDMPTITFTAYANVQPAISVNPPQISLPPGPLASETRPIISIQNNGTNVVHLSDPMVSPNTVKVTMSEPQPNHLYMASLTFPAGFELKPGEKAEFTVKTSHPKFPILKVPIYQTARLKPIAHRFAPDLTNRTAWLKGKQASLLPPPPHAPAQ